MATYATRWRRISGCRYATKDTLLPPAPALKRRPTVMLSLRDYEFLSRPENRGAEILSSLALKTI